MMNTPFIEDAIEDAEEQLLQNRIKHIWFNLTDEEIAYHEGQRDVFFLAVRKKYGLPRAQAEDMLRHIEHTDYEDAA